MSHTPLRSTERRINEYAKRIREQEVEIQKLRTERDRYRNYFYQLRQNINQGKVK